MTDDESLTRQATERLEAMQGLREQLAAIRGSAASEDGRIRAAVLPGGLLRPLELDPRVRKLPVDDLAESIVEVVRNASEDAATQSGALVESVLPGAGSSIAGMSDPASLAATREDSEARMSEILDSVRRGFGSG